MPDKVSEFLLTDFVWPPKGRELKHCTGDIEAGLLFGRPLEKNPKARVWVLCDALEDTWWIWLWNFKSQEFVTKERDTYTVSRREVLFLLVAQITTGRLSNVCIPPKTCPGVWNSKGNHKNEPKDLTKKHMFEPISSNFAQGFYEWSTEEMGVIVFWTLWRLHCSFLASGGSWRATRGSRCRTTEPAPGRLPAGEAVQPATPDPPPRPPPRHLSAPSHPGASDSPPHPHPCPVVPNAHSNSNKHHQRHRHHCCRRHHHHRRRHLRRRNFCNNNSNSIHELPGSLTDPFWPTTTTTMSTTTTPVETTTTTVVQRQRLLAVEPATTTTTITASAAVARQVTTTTTTLLTATTPTAPGLAAAATAGVKLHPPLQHQASQQHQHQQQQKCVIATTTVRSSRTDIEVR